MKPVVAIASVMILAAPAEAQLPPSGVTGSLSPPGQAFTPAPVPRISPGGPSGANSVLIPEQIAPSAGPARASPFSSLPANPPAGAPPSLGR